MRFFGRGIARISVFLLLGFFSSVADAQQNQCDPDGESYDASVCFEYVRTLEAKSAKAKSDLAAARREASFAKSQLAAANINFTKAAMNLRFDIELRDRTISALGKTIGILSEEKEAAWRYVDMIARILAAVIGLSVFGGILWPCLFRKRASYQAVKERDEKIRDLEARLRIETEAKLMAIGDAAAFRRELFHKDPDLWSVRGNIINLLDHVRKEMPRLETIREALGRTLVLVRTHGERVGELSSLAPPRETV